jgi:glycosyltransferase involved in cell wall biosynthesis
MPSSDSWGGPISSEPPFVDALRKLGHTVNEQVYVYGDKETPTRLFHRIIRVLKTAFRFRKVVASDSFDVIHLNTAFDLRTILRDSVSIFVMKPGRTPVFLKFHGSEPELFTKANFIVRFLIKYIATKSAGFGIHTSAETKALVSIGFAEEKLHFVKNAITIATELNGQIARDKKSPDARFELLFISRFVLKKGLLETIRACSILKKAGYSFKLTCLGDGELKFDAIAEAQRLGVFDQVKFTGYLPESEVTPYFFRSDILIFPTGFGEGFPNVVFKSIVAGLPIVATRFRAADDYLSEPENCLFCSRDPIDIAEKIATLIDDEALRTRMSICNLSFGRSLEPSAIAEDFISIYEKLLVSREQT